MKYVLFGTYRDLETARKVVDELVSEDFPRGDIGLARKDTSEEVPRDPLIIADMQALVTVTTAAANTNAAMQTMRRYDPITLDMRDVQWRMRGWDRISPSEEEFTAVKREEGKTSR